MNLRLLILFVLMYQFAISQSDSGSDNIKIFKIDSSIRGKAIKNLSAIDKQHFASKTNAEFYLNDSLFEIDKDSLEHLSAWYWWHNDTLTLTGGRGQLSIVGFIADIYKDKIIDIKHIACADERTRIAYKIGIADSTRSCVRVPCTFAELVVSDLSSTKDDKIYGVVMFTSENYYYQRGQEIGKLRVNMRFYFRAVKLGP